MIESASPQFGFFMSARDVFFWLRSAQADARIAHLRRSCAPGEAFDCLYATIFDPFGAEAPQYRYQSRKYASLMSMLPARKFGTILDIGCGLGSFTRRLATRGDFVLGVDLSHEAVKQASLLSSNFPQVSYRQNDLIGDALPPGGFDLIVLADTLYYLDGLTRERLKLIASRLSASLNPHGLLLLANHFFFGFDAASRASRRMHDEFNKKTGFNVLAEYRRAFFLATVLERAS